MDNNLLSQPDETLVSLYAKGNNEAFDILLNRHKDRIYSYIYYIVHNRDLADDIFQETFVKAIMTIRQGRYTENGKFPAWITRIAHNLIIDYYRQEKSENQISNDELSADIFNNKDLSEGTVEDYIVKNQIDADIRKLIKTLPDNQKEVLIMRYYKNMSFKEIADATKVSINTALGRMRYAILNMRRLAEENNIALTL
ncbi:MAG: sigma-70 family RNA polymerase sigma factor [Coprobacter sp.]|nr:sigma-70 family RNA polymerase sigma factor [Coprobacter sp.]